jgi:hypothetical protein
LSICAASVTVPFSVTAPSLAMTLILPALISLYFEMAAYAFRRSARFAFLPVSGVAAPDATIADAAETLAGAPDAAPFWAHAFTETATTNAPTAIPSPSIFFIDFASC